MFKDIKADLELMGFSSASLSYFYAVLKDIKWFKRRTDWRLGKCGLCESLKKKVSKYWRQPAERRKWEEELKKHREFQRVQRRKYYKHKMKAARNPEKYVSLIVDGMDNIKTVLPHPKPMTKEVKGATQLKLGVTGVLCHGRQINHQFYHMPDFWPHGPDHVISIINDVIKKIQHAMEEKPEFRGHGGMPEVLYLQLDNTCKENKCHQMVCYLNELVHRDVFRKVKLTFLMAGHTHEDIDQVIHMHS